MSVAISARGTFIIESHQGINVNSKQLSSIGHHAIIVRPVNMAKHDRIIQMIDENCSHGMRGGRRTVSLGVNVGFRLEFLGQSHGLIGMVGFVNCGICRRARKSHPIRRRQFMSNLVNLHQWKCVISSAGNGPAQVRRQLVWKIQRPRLASPSHKGCLR